MDESIIHQTSTKSDGYAIMEATDSRELLRFFVVVHHGCEHVQYHPANQSDRTVIGGVANVTLERHVFTSPIFRYRVAHYRFISKL